MLYSLTQLQQAVADGAPHACVSGTQVSGLPVVIVRVLVQVQHLVRLAQTVPGAVIHLNERRHGREGMRHCANKCRD